MDHFFRAVWLQFCIYKRLNTINSVGGMEWGGAGGGGWWGYLLIISSLISFSIFFFCKNLEFYTVPSKAIIPIVG